MSNRDGKTFAGTLAALNKQTVSGNLWKQWEEFYTPLYNQCNNILYDLQEYSKGLSGSSMQTLAERCKNLVGKMNDVCMTIINAVENEEENASLPHGELLKKATPPPEEIF